MEFLRENRAKPFLLYLAYGAPHMGKMPQPPEDMAVYQGKKFQLPDYKQFPEARDYPEESLQERYTANYTPVTTIDRNMGRLLEELRKLDLENNTIVIFTSDNGYCLGRHGLMSKGNARFLGTTVARPNMFDDSIVVPFIVRWPGVIRPGSVCEEIVSHLDIFPTLMDVAGLDPAAQSALEGFSILPLLREQARVWRDAVYLIYDMKFHAVAHMRMIRTRGWKLIHHYENERKNELYDLRNDPGELKNLYGDPAVRDAQHFLTQNLKNWEGRVGARKEDLLARRRPY
jgi:choline-sulfatase